MGGYVKARETCYKTSCELQYANFK